MLIPLVARMQCQPRRGVNRYAAWEQAIEQLRDDWKPGSSVDPGQLDRYLGDVPVDQRLETLLDLVTEHLGLSWAAGDGRLVDEYLPVLSGAGFAAASVADMPADLVEVEFLARHTVPHGDLPDREHYARRFPGRCDIQQALIRREVAAGRFVALSQLGHGASAEVWEAFDRAEQTLAAIKLPRTGSAGRRQWLERFMQEAQLTAALNHPGIVNLRACHMGQLEPVFVMKLVKGRLLSDEIRDYHQPPASRTSLDQRSLLARLLHCLASACDALEHAHSRSVVHCDVKPGNIMNDASGRGAVLDWGLARQLGSIEHALSLAPDATPGRLEESRWPTDLGEGARLVAGTPDYMAPEQLAGECDARTDVFGLGATLYEILAGRAPHAWSDGLRPADWMRRVQDARFVRPRRWNPTAAKVLESICLKALSRDPRRRQPSAAALADEIRQCPDYTRPNR